jgi:protoporphyrinogen oxidase
VSSAEDTAERKFMVVGGGPAGLTAAYDLIKLGYTPQVFEKSYTVGGIARTEQYKDFHFDMGGHRFFTKAVEVNEMWQEVLADEFLKRPRLSRIYYKKKFFDYPLKPLNALVGLGFVESILIGFSYLRWTMFPSKVEDTFEQWVTNRFGRRLFLTFFKTYTEKVWGISCSELKAEWAAQRIKDLSLKTALLSMFFKPKTTIKTLIEQFEYPKQGPGMMWRAVTRIVNERGGKVHMEADVIRFRRDGSRVVGVDIATEDGEQSFEGTDFISSMPITEFVRKMDPPAPPEVLAAADHLKYRDFLTVCLIIDQPELFPDNWIYIHEDDVQVGRIQNFKNWSPHMVPDQSKTSLGLEYFCNEGDDLWTMSDEDLVALGTKEIGMIGLANSADVSDGCVFKVPKSYPVYDADYAEHLEVIKSYADSLENFQTIGRNGMHRYNNQDHAMLTGMYAVRNAVAGGTYDLWSVNAEQEYHEEVEDKGPGRNQQYVEAQEELGPVDFPRPLDRVALGAGVGVLAALVLFVLTAVLVIEAGPATGKTLGLLRNYLPGYTVTWQGAFMGLGYGFVLGYALGWTFALIKNGVWFVYLSAVRRRAERGFLRDLMDYI